MRRRAALRLALGAGLALITATTEARMADDTAPHPYAGLWVTADNHVRHLLRPDGRYVEARGGRECAYQGRYEITGDHIEYWDDAGFTADGDFVDGVLHHGGMVLRRRPGAPKPEPGGC